MADSVKASSRQCSKQSPGFPFRVWRRATRCQTLALRAVGTPSGLDTYHFHTNYSLSLTYKYK